VPTAPDADHRDLRLDACRGVALWFIFLDHVPDNLLSWLTLRNYGFSDTTEIFFFVSGYTCMIAYGGALQRQGWRTMVARALRRGWPVWRWCNGSAAAAANISTAPTPASSSISRAPRSSMR
jgi:hypothetical protein